LIELKCILPRPNWPLVSHLVCGLAFKAITHTVSRMAYFNLAGFDTYPVILRFENP